MMVLMLVLPLPAVRARWFRAMERLLDDLYLLESGCHDKSESKMVPPEIHPIDNEENMHVDRSSLQSMGNGKTTFRHSMQFLLSMPPFMVRLSFLLGIWNLVSRYNHSKSESATMPQCRQVY